MILTSGQSSLAIMSFLASYKKCFRTFPFSTGGRIKTKKLLKIAGKFPISWISSTATSTGRKNKPVMEHSTCTPPTMMLGRFIYYDLFSAFSDRMEARKIIFDLITYRVSQERGISLQTLNYSFIPLFWTVDSLL